MRCKPTTQVVGRRGAPPSRDFNRRLGGKACTDATASVRKADTLEVCGRRTYGRASAYADAQPTT